MRIGAQKWQKNYWLSFMVISLFLTIYLIIIGYPIINWDSQRYLRGALFFQTCPFALTSVCYLFHPLVAITGAWGFAIIQIILLAYVTVSSSQFFHKSFIVGLIAIIMSAAAYYAISVMMDIYTAAGLLVLFLILNGNKNIFLYITLSLCFLAHYENIPLFLLSAVAYWIIFHRKKISSALISIIITFIISIISVVLTGYLKGDDFIFFSKARYAMTVPRLMADYPDAARSYMKKYPDSYIGKHKEFYEFALTAGEPSHALLWGDWQGEKGLGYQPVDDNLFKETRSFIVYVLSNYKRELLKNTLKNTCRFLLWPGYEPGLNTHRAAIKQCVGDLLPGQLKSALNSLPYKSNEEQFPIRLKALYGLCYYASFPVILLFIFLSFINRKIKNLEYYPFVVFAAIVILVNALLMSNVIETSLRYQLRIMLLPCLAMNLIVADLLKRHFANKGFLNNG